MAIIYGVLCVTIIGLAAVNIWYEVVITRERKRMRRRMSGY
jgi:hypothetical protein